MISSPKIAACGLVVGIALSACSPPSEQPAPPKQAATPTPAPLPDPVSAPSPHIIGLDGLGELRIGRPPPAEGQWAERGAQIDGGCRIISSSDYPGVYAMVIGGAVRRITVGQRSDFKLVEGIGVGADEQTVRAAFPGFRDEPHKYEDAPAKYLTTPGADRGGPALRFEIGGDGKVKMIHVGLMPELAYVEGCA